MHVLISGHIYTLYTDYRKGKSFENAYLQSFRDQILACRDRADDLILAGDYVYSSSPDCYRFFEEHFLNDVEKHFNVYRLPSTHEIKGVNEGGIQPPQPFFSFQKNDTLFTGISFYVNTGESKFLCHKMVIDENLVEKVLKTWEEKPELKKALILTDLRWALLQSDKDREKVMTLIRSANIVFVGDNEFSAHNYGWINIKGTPVVMTGMGYGLKYEYGGMGSYVIAGGLGTGDELSIKTYPFRCDDGLSRLYEQNFKKLTAAKSTPLSRLANNVKRLLFKR